MQYWFFMTEQKQNNFAYILLWWVYNISLLGGKKNYKVTPWLDKLFGFFVCLFEYSSDFLNSYKTRKET